MCEPWSIIFPTPEIANVVLTRIRVRFPGLPVAGPFPGPNQVHYYGYDGTTEQNVRDLFVLFTQNFQIIPPSDYQEKLREFNTVKAKLNFSELRRTGLFSDVTLEVEGIQLKVHKVVLSASSSYFKTLFTGLQEAGQTIIELKNIHADVFSKLIDIIYGVGISVDDPLLLEVLVLARYFQINGLDYEDILGKIETPDPDEVPVFIDLLRRLYPTGLPISIIELIDIMSIDDKLLPEDILKELRNYRSGQSQ